MPVGEASSDDRLYGGGKLFDLQFAAANPIMPATAVAKWSCALSRLICRRLSSVSLASPMH
jgi:hypothetical protein